MGALSQKAARLSREKKDLIALAALAVTIAVVWCIKLRIGGEQRLSAPVEYWGDALAVAGTVRATSEFSYLPFVPKTVARLGAPFVARWDDFPVTEDLEFFVWGMLARITGLFTAINLAWVTMAILAAGSFFFVARYLRARRSVAFGLALVFGLSRCLFYRNVHHIILSFYWPIPLYVLLGLKLASRRGLERGTRWFRWALVLAALAGTGNPYYLNFALQLIVVAALVGKLAHGRPWRSTLPSVALIGVALGCFLLMNLDSVWARISLGPNTAAFGRSLGHMEQYALRPIDLIVPRQPYDLATFVGQHLPKGVLEYDHTVNRSESAYLGIIGAIGLVWMFLHGAYRGASNRPDRSTLWTVSAIALIAYASTAGLNMLLGMAGLVIFRSTNRVSIFLLAMGLLFLATRVSTLARRLRNPLVLWIAALPIALWGVAEAHPPIEHERHARQRAEAESDRVLVQTLEAKLPPLAGVFLLPYVSWPEGDPFPFRLFAQSRRLRFSYGNAEGRPEAAWVKRVAAMPPDEMLTTLEATGFSALCLAPPSLSGVAKRLAELGRAEVIRSPNGQFGCVLLHPAGPLTAPPL